MIYALEPKLCSEGAASRTEASSAVQTSRQAPQGANMDYEPVVERYPDGEEHAPSYFATFGLERDSDLEEIEAEPRPIGPMGNDRHQHAFEEDGLDEGRMSEPVETFLCPRCLRRAPLHEVVPMPSCPCLFCTACIQAWVGQQLANTRLPAIEGECQVACPTTGCRGLLTAADCQALAPAAFSAWCEAASTAFLQGDDAFIRCPNPHCGVLIEKAGHAPLPFGLELTGIPELDRTPPFLERSPSGTPLSRQALIHRAKCRFRCAVCATDFCGSCLTAPYHLGISCKQNISQQHARRCRFCDALCGEELDTSALLTRPVKVLRRESEQERVDTSWCIEKGELVAVLLWAASVCADPACRKRLERSCSRVLACGHHCGGVRGEKECLPCLERPCHVGALPLADDDCAICWTEPLRQGPAIRLECGHVVHSECAEKKISAGYPGPAITFGFLRCPLCAERMRHPSLQQGLAPMLKLETQVLERGRARFRLHSRQRQRPREKADREATTEEEKAALDQYQFYLCSRCKMPYYGGERRCAPAGDDRAGEGYRADELVCGGCSAGSKGTCKRGHGREFIEDKCRFCCNVASFFCFGTTHFCDDCHASRPDRHPSLIKPCRGPRWCPLGVEHPKQGEEFCLGCAACRSTGQ